MNAYFSLAISIMIGVIGQLCLKAGSVQSSAYKILFFEPYVFLGLASNFLGILFYIYALKYIPLSVAFPSISLSYVAVAFLAHLLWGEAFGARQILALLLIGLGVYTLSR